MHQSTKLPSRSGSTVANAARGAEICGGHRKCDKRDAACELAEEKNGGRGGALRNLPVENSDRCDSRIASESDSEDGLNSDGDDEIERKIDEVCDNEKYDYHESDEEIGEISGKEKSVNGGDCGSQRKILKHNSVNSKKKRVDEMSLQMREACKKGNADARDPFSNRACADNQPNYDGGLEIASERHTQARYPVPVDLDKHGSVQISDSVEDSSRGASECDSEGMSGTSDDTNRRRPSCINNKFSSKIELESSEIGRSRHGWGDSCSPSRDALSSRYFEKSSKHSRYPPSSLHCELQEPIGHENRPRKDSQSHAAKRGTKDGRYHKRWRDGMREHSNQPKKSYYVPYFKNQPDKDASYAIDTKNPCNRHANRGKLREMVMFSYYENDIPYFGQSKRISTYSAGCLPDHGLGPAFLEDKYWDIPNCRRDGHNMSGRGNFLDHKSSEMDYEEALEHNRYHNRRRYPFQGDIDGLRNLSPKYSSAVNQSGAQLMYKGDGVHHRRGTRQNSLSPYYEYDDKFVEGKYRSIFPSSAEGRDRLDRSCDRNVACDGREVEISARDKRRRHSSLHSSGSLRYIETQVDRRRNIKHRPFPFYSSEEPYAYSPRNYIGAPAKKYGAAQENIRCSWKEMHFECGQYCTDVTTSIDREKSRYHPYHDYHNRRRDYQQFPKTYVVRECIKGDQCHDHLVGRRHRMLHSREDVFGSRLEDDFVSGSEEPSYHSKRISKNYKADDSLAFCRVMELNERETGRHNFKMLREKSKHFDGYRKSTQLHSHVQMHPSHQDSVDRLVVVGRKCTLQSSITRTREAGDNTFYGRRDLMEQNEKETNSFENLDASNPEKTVPTDEGKVGAGLSDKYQQSKVSKNKHSEFGDIEEGQIITEEMEKATKCIQKTAPDGNGIAERLDDEKIREIMMKMERRRERFKEPITISQDCEKTSCPLPESNVETAEARLERPARKRRWLGS